MRKSYLDNTRSLTILLVVVYHIIYIFNAIIPDGVIGPVAESNIIDVVQYLLYPWFMVILFIISGMCSRYYLEKHTAKEYLKARTRKLLVPSTIGLLVFGWLQGYINMAISNAFENIPDTVPGFVLYPIMCISGIGVLWTIQMMWILSLVLLLIRKIEKGKLEKLGAKVGIVGLLLLGILVWGSAQILNTPVIAVYRFGIYGFTFLLGYYVFSHEEVTDVLKKYSIYLMLAALILGIVYALTSYGTNYAVSPFVNAPLAIAYGWMMCLAILGCMKRWGDHNGKLSVFLSAKSFGLYVFHYLTLSAFAYYITKYTSLRGALVYLLTAVAAFGGAFLLNEIVVRIPILRWCVLGIRKEKKKDVL